MPQSKQKLYCYVDETGQDTVGRFFLVAIVITGGERDTLTQVLEQIEKETKKGISKWKKTSSQRRVAYIKKIIKSNLFCNKINYAVFFGRKDYLELTIIATAKAITLTTSAINYETSVYIDGLGRRGRFIVGAGLRHRHIKVKRVRGLTDESNAIIRLADAIAGFVRDCLEANKDMAELYEQAISTELIKKL